jgi:hypothetical protein
MLQVARLAPRLLGESADLVVNFLRGQLNPDGGFKDRSGDSDLYYTDFGLEGLLALRADLPADTVASYLRCFSGSLGSLDLVHTACLARCWAALPPALRAEAPRDAILARIESFRSRDGSYHARPNSDQGTLYGCFLGLGTYQDLGLPFPDPHALLRCAQRLRTDDGGYANGDDLPVGLTPPTAAAATLFRALGHPVPAGLADWLLARHRPEGGFYATPMAPIPDLLSTATALHALAGIQADLEPIKEPCLDFIDSLWTNQGAFYGMWTEEAVDCEYTFYGLLALGHLSL